MKITTTLCALAALPTLGFANCNTAFTKSGNPFSGTSYTSQVSVADLTPRDALAQMRGLLIAEKMDVITEDPEGGTLLAEQRATTFARAIPMLISVGGDGAATRIGMTIKTDKGVFAKKDDMERQICAVLDKVIGGEAGRTAAATGAKAENAAFEAKRDAYAFSQDIANEAQHNALAVTARHKGRTYTLSGRIDYIQEDGDGYNVSFEIPDMRDRAVLPDLGQADFRVSVACLFRQNQLAMVLTLREKQRVEFTGTFLRYDDFKKVAWLENCKPTA